MVGGIIVSSPARRGRAVGGRIQRLAMTSRSSCSGVCAVGAAARKKRVS